MVDFRAPKGCTGFSMQDGSRVDSNRSGRIVVDNPAHIAAIRKASRNSNGIISEAVYGHGGDPSIPEKHCPGCNFIGYKFQDKCPRCGQKLEESR